MVGEIREKDVDGGVQSLNMALLPLDAAGLLFDSEYPELGVDPSLLIWLEFELDQSEPGSLDL